MGRLLLAGALVMATFAVAVAGPTRKVQVETEPPGATVYLDDVDRGAVCEQTPCTFSAPVGSSTIIIRLDQYEPEITLLDVPKGKRPLPVKYTLKGAMGTIAVDEPRGALVRIDMQDKGRAPVRVEVSSTEGHHVSVTHNGKTLFDDFVDVATGDEYTVKPKTASAGGNAVAIIEDDEDEEDDEGGGGGGGTGGGTGGSDGISGRTDTSSSGHVVTGGVAFDVGFRHFTYDNAITGNLREEEEGGQVIAGPALEVWPGRMLGVSPLRGLSVFARLQLNIAGQQVQGGDLMGTVTTKWSSHEVSLRQRWTFGAFAVEVGGGYVQDTFSFTTTVAADRDLMPEATYSSLRVGGKLAYAAGSAEPYISGENRIVLSGGTVAERFDEADARGLRGSAGVVFRFGAFSARVEGTLMSYAWTFGYDGIADVGQADGATDSVKLISMLAGYSY